MAPSLSALILLVAFFVMSGSTVFVGALQMRPKPILSSFQLHIRPPPRSGLNPFLICIPFTTNFSYIQEHDTDAATWWGDRQF